MSTTCSTYYEQMSYFFYFIFFLGFLRKQKVYMKQINQDGVMLYDCHRDRLGQNFEKVFHSPQRSHRLNSSVH